MCRGSVVEVMKVVRSIQASKKPQSDLVMCDLLRKLLNYKPPGEEEEMKSFMFDVVGMHITYHSQRLYSITQSLTHSLTHYLTN